jgi:hypothetical protein
MNTNLLTRLAYHERCDDRPDAADTVVKLMRKLPSKLWADDAGFIISVEMLFICVILVIGLVAGWTALRGAVATESGSVGVATMALDPDYATASAGSTGGEANSSGPVVHTNTSLNLGQNGLIVPGGNGATFDTLSLGPIFPTPVTP